MRLNYHGILEQTFNDKLRGYNKEEVQTFLRLIANDFREMEKEIKQLQKELEKKDQQNKTYQESLERTSEKTLADLQFAPEALKEKARKFMRLAQEQATRYKKKVEKEVTFLRGEIKKLKEEKQHLTKDLRPGPQSKFDFKKSTDGPVESDHASTNNKT